MIQKNKPAISQKLRKSAKGQVCMFQISGICNHNPETTVLCHLPSSNKGMGFKGLDFISVYGCSACHDEIDSRTRHMSEDEKKAFMYDALVNALTVYWNNGYLTWGNKA